jgi:hypothetical protein
MNMLFMQGEKDRFFRGQDLILRGGKGAQFSWGQGNRLASSAGLSMGSSLRIGFEKKIFWERGLP